MKNRVLQFFDVPHSPSEKRAPRATYIGPDDLYRSPTSQWVNLNPLGYERHPGVAHGTLSLPGYTTHRTLFHHKTHIGHVTPTPKPHKNDLEV